MDVITVRVHLDVAEDDLGRPKTVWWAESDDLAGFTAAADSLRELRERCTAVISELVSPDATVRWELVGDEHKAADGYTFWTRVLVAS